MPRMRKKTAAGGTKKGNVEKLKKAEKKRAAPEKEHDKDEDEDQDEDCIDGE